MPTASSSIVRRSVLRYLAMSSLVLLVVGFAMAFAVSRISLHEELHESEVQTRNMAEELVAPLVTAELRRGDPDAVERLATELATRMRDGSVIHVVLYDVDGDVLWSDKESISGEHLELASDITELFGTAHDIVNSPGEREHPWSEAGEDDLIEIYTGAVGADHEPFVFEAYISPEFIEADRSVVLRGVLPVVVGAMVLFLLATLPLAVGLARRVDRAGAARADLVDRSLAALQEERHRMARVLHDGVIQDLSAVGYALSALAQESSDAEGREAARPTTAGQAETLRRLLDMVQGDVRQLRSVVGDLIETEVDGSTLRDALGALQTRGSNRFGLEVDLDVDPVADTLDETLAAAVFAVVREGVVNAGVHAHATRVDVVVQRLRASDSDDVALADVTRGADKGLLVVTVRDDGVGLVGAGTAGTEDRDHFGLRLLRQRLEDLHGSLSLTDAPGGGAVLTAAMPLSPPEN